jgi:hypothetical protein
MVVVPKEAQATNNVAQEFFNRTFGVVAGQRRAAQMFHSFLAISTLGNIIVLTYTASRVKQEIAKEGFLGSISITKFFARDLDFSFGRLLIWMKKKGWLSGGTTWLRPKLHSEKTPVGALTLHLIVCLVAIFATAGVPANDAYSILTGLIAYLITAFFGFLLSLGILLLRFFGPPETQPLATTLHPGEEHQQPVKKTWTEMTGKTINPTLSVICAVVYLIGNAYPIVTNWIPLPATSKFANPNVAWYAVPVISWSILGLGTLWFVAFMIFTKRREYKKQETFVIVRKPEFDYAGRSDSESATQSIGEGVENGNRYLVQIHETVYLRWRGNEQHHRDSDLPRMDANMAHGYRYHGHDPDGRGLSQSGRPPRATDFDDF